jgi:hypothetical protein
MQTQIKITNQIFTLSYLLLTKNSQRCLHTLPVPVRVYSNADTEKIQIVEENRDRAGVYR